MSFSEKLKKLAKHCSWRSGYRRLGRKKLIKAERHEGKDKDFSYSSKKKKIEEESVAL